MSSSGGRGCAALRRPSIPPWDLPVEKTAICCRAWYNGGRDSFGCDEAIVREPVEPSRLSLHWLLRRALSGGQDFARHSLAGRYGTMSTAKRVRFFLRALAQALAAAALALVVWPLGRHHAARWLTTLSANVGKLSVFWG